MIPGWSLVAGLSRPNPAITPCSQGANAPFAIGTSGIALTRTHSGQYIAVVQAVEFTIELTSKPTVNIPQELAAQLPATGQA